MPIIDFPSKEKQSKGKKEKSLDLTEIVSLIKIRGYCSNAAQNAFVDKQTATSMNNLLNPIDQKIISLLQDKAFQQYLNQ